MAEAVLHLRHEDMVSLVDLIYAVAPRVPIDPKVRAHIDRELAQRTGPRRVMYSWWSKTLERTIKASEAASVVDQCLTNFPDRAPRWYDWGDHGLPKAIDAARAEGHGLLVSCAQFMRRFEDATEQGAFPFDGTGKADFGCVKAFQDAAGDLRARQIGFVAEEIRAFLDRVGVPHSFPEWDAPIAHPVADANPIPKDTVTVLDATLEDDEPLAEEPIPQNVVPPLHTGPLLGTEEPIPQNPGPTVQYTEVARTYGDGEGGLPGGAPVQEDLTEIMTADTKEGDARIGRKTDSIAKRIRDAVRAVRLTSREHVNSPLTDDMLQRAAWKVLISWANGKVPGEPKKPLIGANKKRRLLIWEKDFETQNMDFEAFARRLDPSRRGPKKSKAAAEPQGSAEVREEVGSGSN